MTARKTDHAVGPGGALSVGSGGRVRGALYVYACAAVSHNKYVVVGSTFSRSLFRILFPPHYYHVVRAVVDPLHVCPDTDR